MKLIVIPEKEIPDCNTYAVDLLAFQQIKQIINSSTSIDELIESLQKYFFKLRLKKVDTHINWYTDEDSVLITHQEKIICRCVQKM